MGLTYANATATVALFSAPGGTSYAAVQLGTHEVQGSNIATAAVSNSKIASRSVTGNKLKSDAVTSSKVADGSLRARDFRAGDLPNGVPGRDGTPGPEVDTGPPGADAVSFWAVVNDNGSQARGRGVASSNRVGTGQFVVDFDRDVSACSFVASLGDGVSRTENGGASATNTAGIGGAGNVFIRTVDSGGTFQNLPFHLQVAC